MGIRSKGSGRSHRLMRRTDGGRSGHRSASSARRSKGAAFGERCGVSPGGRMETASSAKHSRVGERRARRMACIVRNKVVVRQQGVVVEVRVEMVPVKMVPVKREVVDKVAAEGP